jgi:hypothetical protein
MHIRGTLHSTHTLFGACWLAVRRASGDGADDEGKPVRTGASRDGRLDNRRLVGRVGQSIVMAAHPASDGSRGVAPVRREGPGLGTSSGIHPCFTAKMAIALIVGDELAGDRSCRAPSQRRSRERQATSAGNSVDGVRRWRCDAVEIVKIGSVVLSARDVQRASTFWRAALGYVPGHGNDAMLVQENGEGPFLVLDAEDRTHLGPVGGRCARAAGRGRPTYLAGRASSRGLGLSR